MAEARWRITADDSDVRKKLVGIKRLQQDILKQGETVVRRLRDAQRATGNSPNYKQETDGAKAAARASEALAKARLEEAQARKHAAQVTKQDREAQLQFMEALRQSRLAIQAHREAQARANAELIAGRKTLQEYRIEMAKLNLEEKKRRQAEQAARKVLNENSQYRQLNKQLGELRQRSKDVLSEMFILEGQGKKNTVAYKQLADQARGLVAQTQYLDRGLKKIDATLGLHQRNVGNYASALTAISPMFARLNSQLAMMGVNLSEISSSRNGFKQLGSELIGFGKNVGKFLLSPVGLVITALSSLYLLISRNFGTIKEFNSGLINVSKTTGIAGRELTKLGDSIINLSRQLQVVGTDKLLEYATVAGQLGVKGTQNILAFTEALAKLETASDISGEEGGAEIARLLTLVDGGVQHVKSFGDEIVNLGNNFAATEAEILSNATQIAQNVGQYRIGRQEILAFATATKSVGLEAELVGSTFGRTLGAFEKMIRTGKGVGEILKIVGGTAKELSERFKSDASGVFIDYIRGLNELNKAGGSVNAALAKTGVVAIRDQRVIASLATNGYDVLTDAINKSKNAVGALDAEFANKSSALDSQIGRIRVAWNNLILDIENGEGVLGTAVVRFADGLARILDRMSKILNPTGLNEFMASLTSFDIADMIREMNIAYRDAEEVIQSLNDFDVSTANQDKLQEKYKEIEDTVTTLRKQYEIYKKKVNEGVLTEGGKAKLKDYEKLLNTLATYMWQIDRNITTPLPTNDKKKPEETIEEIDNEEKRRREQAYRNQRTLQDKIDDINRDSLRATMKRNEQEVESVKEKYRKIREEIEEFRKDPKNKGFNVDASGLSSAEARELAQVRYRHETEELIKNLNLQRELWQDYESWRMELGEESANNRYAAELEVIKDFKHRIKQEIISIGQQLTASLSGETTVKLTGAEEERLKQLQDMLKSIEDYEQKQRDANLRRVLQDYATFEQRRVRLHKQAQEDMALLDEAGRKERKKALDAELLELYRAEVEGNERLQEFMKTADTSASALALRAMKHGKEFALNLIDGMTGDPEVRAKLRKEMEEFFDHGIEALKDENYGNVVSLISGFDQLIQQATQFDRTMSTALRTIGDMVNQVGQLATTLSRVIGKTGDNLSKTGGIASIVGAVLSVIGSISNAIEQAQQRERDRIAAGIQYSQDYQIRQMEAVTRALERQLELVKDIYGTARIDAYRKSIIDAAKSFEESLGYFDGQRISSDNYAKLFEGKIKGQKYELTGVPEFDMIIEALNSGKSVADYYGARGKEYNRLLAYYRGLIDSGLLKPIEFGFESVADITSEQLDYLYSLIEGSKLDEVTRRQVENIIDQYNLWREATNQLNEELTGSTFKSITDEIVSMFERGTTAAQDFADNFEKLMQKAILNSFKRKYLEEGLQEWYDEFAQAAESDGQLTAEEVSRLEEMYNTIIGNAKSQFEQLKQISGISFDDSQSNPNSLQGAYARASQESIDLLAGQTGAMRLHLYELVKLASANNSNTVNQIDIMNGQLNALIAIERNTGVTAQHSMEYLPYLKSMDTKMGDSLGLQLRAAGKYGF